MKDNVDRRRQRLVAPKWHHATFDEIARLIDETGDDTLKVRRGGRECRFVKVGNAASRFFSDNQWLHWCSAWPLELFEAASHMITDRFHQPRYDGVRVGVFAVMRRYTIECGWHPLSKFGDAVNQRMRRKTNFTSDRAPVISRD